MVALRSQEVESDRIEVSDMMPTASPTMNHDPFAATRRPPTIDPARPSNRPAGCPVIMVIAA
jgi:hypothetical protein